MSRKRHKPPQAPSPSPLAQAFRAFATAECTAAPLYAHLAHQVAADAELLHWLAQAPPNHQLPRQFFAAVYERLLAATDAPPPLAAFYPTLTNPPQAPNAATYPAFRAFWAEHQRALLTRLTDDYLHPNEIGRMGPLAVGLWHAARQAARSRFQKWAIVDIGASAGLHLLWDACAFDFGSHHIGGPSAVEIHCENRGIAPALLTPATFPTLTTRIGIDREPLDLRDPAARRWAQAMIFPEAAVEQQQFAALTTLALAPPPALVAGNVVQVLPSVLNSLPRDTGLCVFTSFTLHLLPGAACGWLANLLLAQAHLRDVAWVALEPFSPQLDSLVECLTIINGQPEHQLLVQCDPRGAWVAPLAHEPALTALRFAFQQSGAAAKH